MRLQRVCLGVRIVDTSMSTSESSASMSCIRLYFFMPVNDSRNFFLFLSTAVIRALRHSGPFTSTNLALSGAGPEGGTGAASVNGVHPGLSSWRNFSTSEHVAR